MCFLILAGKNVTTEGAVLGGHNNDLFGNTSSEYIVVPGARHEPGEVVVHPKPWFNTGCAGEIKDFEIPQAPQTHRCFMLQTYRGYMTGDISAVNEHRVSIVGGLSLGADIDERAKAADPFLPGGVVGGARALALQRSKTARECVETLGSIFDTYGTMFPSAVGIMDPDEAWYLEIGGGTTWLAVRVPDDAYMVQSNGYRIGVVNFDDGENVIHSPNLPDILRSKGLWPHDEPVFHWARTFGGRMAGNPATAYYNLRRAWAAMDRFSGSRKLDPDAMEHPLFLSPDEKIDRRAVMGILRDRFAGTVYDAYPESGGRGTERPVCVPSCIHSAVVEMRRDTPAETGAVLWGCIGSPATSPYVPHYPRHRSVLPPYTKGGPKYNGDSAFWAFRSLSNLAVSDHQAYGGKIFAAWSALEEHAERLQRHVEAEASLHPGGAEEILTAFSNGLDAAALETARELESELHTEIASGLFRCFAKPGLDW